MMGKFFPGVLVFHIILALWQGCGVGVAASTLQTLCILLGIESESKQGLAQGLCCPVPGKAWNCSSLHIFPLVIHTHLHIFSLGFGRSIIFQFSWFLLACFISASSALLLQPQVPRSCFSKAPLLQSSPFLSVSL